MVRPENTPGQRKLGRSRLAYFLLAALIVGLFGMAACVSPYSDETSSSSSSGGSGGNGCQAGYCNSNGYCCPKGTVGCQGYCYNSTGDAYSATGDSTCLSVKTVC
ncbi:MAG TPA: hypothetical protein VFM15_10215 [Gammaproteobacteria bacterium]|nr:hypothetical protein [Gammaproteobacteria bacterium]